MKLYVRSTALDETKTIDISAMIQDTCCVTDAESLFASMLQRLCGWVTYSGGTFADMYCDSFDGNDEVGFDLGLASGNEFFERLHEVALLAWYIEHEGKYVEEARIFAVISNEGLQYFDFENIGDRVEDDYHGSFDDDYDDWARQYLEDTDQAISEGLDAYFDYEKFARDLFIDTYSVVEWEGQKFIYGN